MVRPTTGTFPQISHRFAMMFLWKLRTDAPNLTGANDELYSMLRG
jgi:hypothetical protein